MMPTSCATKSLCEWLKLTLVTLPHTRSPHTQSPHSMFPPRQCHRLRHRDSSNISQVPKRKENLALQSEEAPPNCNLHSFWML